MQISILKPFTLNQTLKSGKADALSGNMQRINSQLQCDSFQIQSKNLNSVSFGSEKLSPDQVKQRVLEIISVKNDSLSDERPQRLLQIGDRSMVADSLIDLAVDNEANRLPSGRQRYEALIVLDKFLEKTGYAKEFVSNTVRSAVKKLIRADEKDHNLYYFLGDIIKNHASVGDFEFLSAYLKTDYVSPENISETRFMLESMRGAAERIKTREAYSEVAKYARPTLEYSSNTIVWESMHILGRFGTPKKDIPLLMKVLKREQDKLIKILTTPPNNAKPEKFYDSNLHFGIPELGRLVAVTRNQKQRIDVLKFLKELRHTLNKASDVIDVDDALKSLHQVLYSQENLAEGLDDVMKSSSKGVEELLFYLDMTSKQAVTPEEKKEMIKRLLKFQKGLEICQRATTKMIKRVR